MPASKKSSFKPFIRVTILSAILALLIIFLGINYHWGDYLKPEPKPSTELSIPEKSYTNETVDKVTSKIVVYNPEIVDSKIDNALLDSMNKEQIAEHCINLLSKNISDEVTLELATVNCVMSNYQETFQNSQSSADELKSAQLKQLKLKRQCTSEYQQINQLSQIDRELLIGICVSDRMNLSN